MIIVSNTTPFISLASIGQLSLLQKLFKKIFIPQAVYSEIKMKQSFGYDEIDVSWIQTKEIQGKTYLGLLLNDLDIGEAEAILLAKEMKADVLIIDERIGYKIAQSQGLMVIGTLTVLLMAKKANIIQTIKPLLDEMMNKGRWYSEMVYQKFLQDIGEL